MSRFVLLEEFLYPRAEEKPGKHDGQQRVYLVCILFRAFLAVAGRGVPGIPVTKIRCDSHPHRWATKIQPIDVSEDHVKHFIVWQLQMFSERETMITPSEQHQDTHRQRLFYTYATPVQEITVPPAATLEQPTT